VKLELKDFQLTAAEQLTARLRSAIVDYEQSGDKQALSLSAPTGAGKTVVATAVLERLFDGDEQVPGGDPNAVVLWLTDQPSLNEQTRRKMLGASDVLSDQRLVTLDSSFHDEELGCGRVYFLNIQKLARNQPLVNRRDARTRTIWETINNTAERRGGRFVLIIDEAHRGMTRGRGDEETRTIVQRFILGYNGTLEPVPVVLGISATPERFNDLVEAAPDRTMRRTNVDPDLVRASGLLKDAVLLRHPDKVQPGDTTLLREAVKEWKATTARWAAYAQSETVPPVEPILVIQVQDSRRRGGDSDTDLVAVLDTIYSAVPGLPSDALAHTFDIGGPVSVGARTIRYIRPEDAQEDPSLRIVLFKTGLTTGWDCPRAEVMFSFRRAKEYVSIAQLIGRMVRTPLARRVSGADLLNTVSLFLPQYDRETVKQVVARLQSNPDDVPPIETITRPVVCRRNAKVPPGVVDVIEGLPTYVVPGHGRTNQVTRLMKLATLLVGDGIDSDALNLANRRLLDILSAERKRLDRAGVFTQRVDAGGNLDVRVLRADLAGGVTEGGWERIPVDDRNLNDLFRQAGNRLREGMAVKYWRRRVQSEKADPRVAKIESYVLSRDTDAVQAIDEAARKLVVQWMNIYDRSIRSLGDVSRQRYFEIQGQAKVPERVSLVVPDERAYPDGDTQWPRHVLAGPGGNIPLSLGGWEAEVLKRELADPTLKGWYRNPTGGAASLRLPYTSGDVCKAMYPDFVMVHEVDNELRPSIVDPHGHHLGDAPNKARGLADYAKTQGYAYHRIDMVVKVDDLLRRIDLKNEQARKTVANVTTQAGLIDAFEAFGTAYG